MGRSEEFGHGSTELEFHHEVIRPERPNKWKGTDPAIERLTAHQNGEPVGHVEYQHDPPHLHIDMIKVPEEHQGKGIASRLMDEMASRFSPDEHRYYSVSYSQAGLRWKDHYEATRGWAPDNWEED